MSTNSGAKITIHDITIKVDIENDLGKHLVTWNVFLIFLKQSWSKKESQKAKLLGM